VSTPAFNPQPCCDGSVSATVEMADQFTTVGLCLADGTPIGVINRRTDAAVIVQDGWVNLLTGAFAAGPPPVGTGACGGSLNIQTSDVLCDVTPADGTVHGLVLIQYHYAPDGSVESTAVIDATTGAPYTPVGTITICPTDTGIPDNDMQVLCDRQADGSLVPFVRDYRRNATGQINGFADWTLAGAAYTVTGTVQSCVPRVSDSLVLCDASGTRFLRTYTYGPSGSVQVFTDTTLSGAPFTPTGAVGLCAPAVATDLDFVEELLCDSNATQFIRRFAINSATGAVVSTTDITLSGAGFVPVGTVGRCTDAVVPDLDFLQEVLCDSTGTAFIRRYALNSATGVVTTTSDLTFAGATFVPSGAVGRCVQPVATDLDFLEELLCDSTGTAFIRRFTLNSATGAVTATNDLTLAGVAFTPVGTVGRCTDPAITSLGFVEEVLCDSTGAVFLRRFTVNAATGIVVATVDLTLAGAAFVPVGPVGLCPASVSTPTVSAQAKALTATQSWVLGTDVIGTLTSVSVVVATGTANVVDNDGTAVPGVPAGITMSWSNDVEGRLLGPQSITAGAASTVYVFWTQK